LKEIWFDGRFINPTTPDGITSFSIGLVSELSRLMHVNVLIHLEAQRNLLPENVSFLKVNDPTSIQELTLAKRLNSKGIGVLVSPMQTTSSLGRNFKLVLTLHDLIYYRHRTPPRAFSAPVRLGWLLFHLSYFPQRLLLNRADLVLTVSETSRREILEAKLTKRTVEVVHNASELEIASPIEPRHDSEHLVYMGSYSRYKNVEFLIKSMALLPEMTLVLLSRLSDTKRKKLSRLADAVGAKVQFENGVTETEYLAWLRKGFALISASKDEGFGIPIVEAMSQGLPVIVSDISIFQEVAGNAGVFFNNSKSEEFVAAVVKLSKEKTWSSHSRKAIEQSARFSWKNSTQELLASLRKIT
jgi:glycosyltransferase involved in cell wall biosynthesis|tara:strand:+ start:225 stop:1295 length:1071 start_codon:yes stop_codon:yes gene_type:complete